MVDKGSLAVQALKQIAWLLGQSQSGLFQQYISSTLELRPLSGDKGELKEGSARSLVSFLAGLLWEEFFGLEVLSTA